MRLAVIKEKGPINIIVLLLFLQKFKLIPNIHVVQVILPGSIGSAFSEAYTAESCFTHTIFPRRNESISALQQKHVSTKGLFL